jgi:hypothetical protein
VKFFAALNKGFTNFINRQLAGCVENLIWPTHGELTGTFNARTATAVKVFCGKPSNARILYRMDFDFSGKLGLLREESIAMKRKRYREDQITFALRQARSKNPERFIGAP